MSEEEQGKTKILPTQNEPAQQNIRTHARLRKETSKSANEKMSPPLKSFLWKKSDKN